MKSFIKTLPIIFMAFATTSCLDMDPKDQMADTNLWQEPNDFHLFANQFYSWTHRFNDMVFDGGIHTDLRSDILTDKSAKNIYSNGTNTIPSKSQDATGNYSSLYGHIRRCNILITNAEGYGQQADIAQYLGEAYFFRAYSYFELLQTYGDVIIVTEPIDVTDPAMNAERDNRTEVARFIVSDLQKAVDLLPEAGSVKNDRISSQGAAAFLSRVALYEGTWEKSRGESASGDEFLSIAADAASSVMESGKFELFYNQTLGENSLRYMFCLEDGAQCNPAGLDKSSNHEYIFVRKYDTALNPIGVNIAHGCFNNVEVASSKFASMFLCQDGLPIEKSPLFGGYETMVSEWKNRDYRMSNYLMKPGSTMWTYSKPRHNWDDSDVASAYTNNYKPLYANGTGYYNYKWTTEREVTSTYESYDYPLIRYAEVLLNYAEAVYELKGAISDDELNRSINLTRTRLNKKMPLLSNGFVNANGLDMREEIRRERTIELYHEGFRLDDLKRWHAAGNEMPKDFTGVVFTGEFKREWASSASSIRTDAQGRVIYESGRVWSEKNYLMPLPSDQTQLNPNLGQNPGWSN